jgi:hypothetical protein
MGVFCEHLLYTFSKKIKLLQQHVGHLVSTTNAEDYTVHASNRTWTDINNDESQTCLGAAILIAIHALTEVEITGVLMSAPRVP